MRQGKPSLVEPLEGKSAEGVAEVETNTRGHDLGLVLPVPQWASKELAVDRPTNIPRIDDPNLDPTIDHTEPALPTKLRNGLCSRCEGLDLKIQKENRPSFKLVAQLGAVDRLRNSRECRLCQLLYKVRPVLSNPGTLSSSECSLVLFDGEWARPWKAGPSMGTPGSPYSLPGICLDTFATMDDELMFGVLPSKAAEDPRSNTVPYLHDRLYESLTRSGYIRVIDEPSHVNTEISGPKPVRPKVDWDSLRKCLRECTFKHSSTCGASSHEDYRPLMVINCRSRKIVPFPRTSYKRKPQYLALSYIWGPEESAEYATNRGTLPDPVPITISDAMDATLQLGFLFLWVDRYCIPQNIDFIKHKEIRHMDLIYQRAAGTIIACSGIGPWHGLPGCSSRLRSGSSRLAKDKQVIFSVPPDPRCEIEASHWMSRGWTYQEGLLSRRRIFFTEEQVYFECDTKYCFESTALC
jgi:Heterokaryon incompatibility protein (HET)